MKNTSDRLNDRTDHILARMTPNATVFFSSACIMVLELVAGRLVARYIGQSLYTWTTIIGVMLAGISLGNYIGGRVADRAWGRRTLAIQFLLAAGGCVGVLVLNPLVGATEPLASLPLSVRILVHIALVFFIPSTLLGTISPVIAKRALQVGTTTGRAVGNVYAWSIAGSIVGTFLTGFYLLNWIGYTTIVFVSTAGLTSVGLVYLAGSLVTRETFVGLSVPQAVDPPSSGESFLFKGWFTPVATAFIANGCIMLVEVAAGRVISRYYGQSLYSWTSVIGVVLAGMTLGGYVGGRVADRHKPSKSLPALLVFGSVACMLIPGITNFFVKTQVLADLLWPTQILIHATCALLAPSILLGAINPVVVEMALQQGRGAGRTVGSIYAWGSVGSIAGTFLAGYLLVAAIGMMLTIFCAAATLAFLGILYGFRKPHAIAWGTVCLVLALSVCVPGGKAQYPALVLALKQLQSPQTIYVDESQYSYIAVAQQDENDPNIRQMLLDKLVHSKVNLKDPTDLRYEYEWVYSAVLEKRFGAETPVSAMVIGGGGYTFPRYLEVSRPGSHVEVAEIDPAVTEAAFEAFGLPRNTAMKIHNMDARNCVDNLVRDNENAEQPVRFDCVFGDSINDFSVPYHLTTREFNDRIRAILKDDGVYMLNMIDMFDTGRFLSSVVLTCRQTFPYVSVFSCSDRPDERDTFVVVCSLLPLDLAAVPDGIKKTHHYLGRLLAADEIDALTKRAGAVVLTDSFAPVDIMLAPVVRTSLDSRFAMVMLSAEALWAEGKYEAALRRTRKAMRIKPDDPNAHELACILLAKLNDTDAALAEIQQVIKNYPNRDSGFFQLGLVLLAKQDFENAANAFKKVIELNPQHVAAYENLAAVHIQSGSPAAAIPLLRKSLEMEPTSVSGRSNLATALFNTEAFGEAAKELNTILESHPEQPGIYFQLAVTYWKMKDFDNAWKALHKAQVIGDPVDPNFVVVLQRDSNRNQ